MGALQQAYDLLGAAPWAAKKLHTALKSGQVKPAAGEHAIDAALQGWRAATGRVANPARRQRHGR